MDDDFDAPGGQGVGEVRNVGVDAPRGPRRVESGQHRDAHGSAPPLHHHQGLRGKSESAEADFAPMDARSSLAALRVIASPLRVLRFRSRGRAGDVHVVRVRRGPCFGVRWGSGDLGTIVEVFGLRGY
ncbi:MAG: hypothetical protein ACLGIK_14365, partial [Gemmatimonadota bacterium]